MKTTKGLGRLAILLCFLSIFGIRKAEGQSVSDLTRKLAQLQAYPEQVVVNGKIATMDSQLREVQAMAVRNGRILALGTTDEIRFLAGPNTEVLDAKGRRVLPGLIDGHSHPHRFAVEHWLGEEGDAISQKYNDPQLKIVFAKGSNQVEVLRSLEQKVRERARELGPGKWIWVNLWGGSNFSESRDFVDPMFRQASGEPGTITRQLLDTLAPNNPLLVGSVEAVGPTEINTRAQEVVEKFERGGEVELNLRTGVFYDIWMRGKLEEAADFLKRELLECIAAQGVTTHSTHYYGASSIMRVYRLLEEREDLPSRWAYWLNPSKDFGSFYRSLGDFRGLGSDFIWLAGASNEGWETGLICTQARSPRSDDPAVLANRGIRTLRDGIRPACSTIDFEKQPGFQRVRAALEAGLRVGFMHGYSDGTYDALFQMIEQAIAEGKVTLDEVRALRIQMEHNPMIRPDQIPQMVKYDVRPGFNGYQLHGNIKGGAFLKAYGEQYINWIAPLKSLVDAGTHPVFNTDAHLHKARQPENMRMEYPPDWEGNIWAFVEFFVTRHMRHNGMTYNRAEGLDRPTLMKAATIWGAEALLNEKNIGSLEIGKLADFIILDKDYFAIPEDQVHTIKTLLTAIGGKVVFKDKSY